MGKKGKKIPKVPRPNVSDPQRKNSVFFKSNPPYLGVSCLTLSITEEGQLEHAFCAFPRFLAAIRVFLPLTPAFLID
ncbi:hypothetical protein D932_01078 [Enterococcus casseliflavus 14-MB-W-14]|nr:hypothetical protein D932_01078 [Enterococcus casseliflavus 14-MB-W-14]